MESQSSNCYHVSNDLPSFKDHFTLPVRLLTAFSVPSSVESNSKELCIGCDSACYKKQMCFLAKLIAV